MCAQRSVPGASVSNGRTLEPKTQAGQEIGRDDLRGHLTLSSTGTLRMTSGLAALRPNAGVRARPSLSRHQPRSRRRARVRAARSSPSNRPSSPTACPIRRTSRWRARSKPIVRDGGRDPRDGRDHGRAHSGSGLGRPTSQQLAETGVQSRQGLAARRGRAADCQGAPPAPRWRRPCRRPTWPASSSSPPAVSAASIAAPRLSFDISADLEELSRTPVAVVCAGAKAILDIPKTLEVLETKGVPVIGYGTDDFPAFWTRSSGLKADQRLDTPEAVARSARDAVLARPGRRADRQPNPRRRRDGRRLHRAR